MSLLELQNPNAEAELRFEMQGPVFDAGIPIPLLVSSLQHVQSILDKSYLGLIGRQRLSTEDRLRFFLRTQQIKHGSLLADLGVIYTGAQTVLPVFGALGPSGIWEYTKAAFDFITLVLRASRAGQHVTYDFNANNSIVQVNTGTQTQVFNGAVFNIASMSVGHYQELAKALDMGRVTDICLGESSSRDIEISLSDRDIFGFPSRVEDQPHSIECEVYEFDKFDKDGRLRVGPGQTVPEGQYRFEVVGNQSASEYIAAMNKRAVRVVCLREVAENPISGEKIYRLQVTSVGM